MCGIIGFTGKLKAQDVLLTGLASLEYRGYDSAGIAYQRQLLFGIGGFQLSLCQYQHFIFDVNGDVIVFRIGRSLLCNKAALAAAQFQPQRLCLWKLCLPLSFAGFGIRDIKRACFQFRLCPRFTANSHEKVSILSVSRENLQADCVQSRQAGFMQCFPKFMIYFIIAYFPTKHKGKLKKTRKF